MRTLEARRLGAEVPLVRQRVAGADFAVATYPWQQQLFKSRAGMVLLICSRHAGKGTCVDRPLRRQLFVIAAIFGG